MNWHCAGNIFDDTMANMSMQKVEKVEQTGLLIVNDGVEEDGGGGVSEHDRCAPRERFKAQLGL
jgi:hypothetical protein